MFLFARRLRDVVCLQYPQWFRPPSPPTYLLAPLSTTPSPAPSFLFFPLSPESLQDAMNGLQLTPAAGQQHEPDQGKTEQWENRSACNFHPEFPKDGDNDDGGKARRGGGRNSRRWAVLMPTVQYGWVCVCREGKGFILGCGGGENGSLLLSRARCH